MAQSMQIVAILHRIQGTGFQAYVEDPAYAMWINPFLSKDIDFVFEEASGQGPSVAEGLAKRLPNVGYLDIDPPVSERHKYGIPPHTSDGGGIDPVHSYDVYETVVPDQQRKREEEWLRRIKASKFKKGLLICGAAHGLSLAFRL